MDFAQKINKLREQIQQVNEELAWLDESPLTKEDFKARVVEWVNSMSSDAQDAEGSFLFLRTPKGNAQRSRMLTISQRITVPASQHSVVAPFDISIAPQLAWLFGEQITQTLLAKIDAMDYVPGLPLTERPSRRKQLLQNRRVLEEKEEALICESEAANAPVYRRADADPKVVLSYNPSGEMGAEGTRMIDASGPLGSTGTASTEINQALGQSIIPLATRY